MLLEVLKTEGEYSILAQDALFLISSELKRYSIMEETASLVNDFTEYSISKWIEYLYSKDRFEDIIQLLNNYPVLEADYPVYKNIRITCYYFLKQYKNIEKIADNITDTNITPIIADSFIMSGKNNKAKNYIKELPKNDIYSLTSDISILAVSR